jgi:hypothetical protein
MVWLWLGLGLVVVLVGLLVLGWRVHTSASPAQARALFLTQRPQLEALFFQTASAGGKPRGLRWKACEWEPGFELTRERDTGRLAALVGVTIQFEAVEGSDMEGLPAVGNLRNASAVFFFHAGQWRTTGKTLFNLNPDEVLDRLAHQYERLNTD